MKIYNCNRYTCRIIVSIAGVSRMNDKRPITIYIRFRLFLATKRSCNIYNDTMISQYVYEIYHEWIEKKEHNAQDTCIDMNSYLFIYLIDLKMIIIMKSFNDDYTSDRCEKLVMFKRLHFFFSFPKKFLSLSYTGLRTSTRKSWTLMFQVWGFKLSQLRAILTQNNIKT